MRPASRACLRARFVECLRSRFAGNEGFILYGFRSGTGLSMQICPRTFAGAVERSVMNYSTNSPDNVGQGGLNAPKARISRFTILVAFLCVVLLDAASLFAATRANIFEDFRGDPANNGWKIFGQTNLFTWNASNQNVEVTWDSSKPNSYFYKPLGHTLTRDESKFEMYFDLRLHDIAIGTTTNKPYTFQIAVGLLNLRQATNAGFLRGTGYDSPNLFEIDYFPDSGFGATIAPTVISSNNQFATAFILREVTPNDLFKFEMRLGEDGGRVFARIFRNGQLYDSQIFFFPTNFHFSLDTVAIASYSDEGQLPEFAGSVLAHGTVDNVLVGSGNSAVQIDVDFRGRLENGNWRMDFDTMPGWTYTAIRSPDFFIGTFPVPGSFTSTNYGRATLIYTNPPVSTPQFYRIVGTRL